MTDIRFRRMEKSDREAFLTLSRSFYRSPAVFHDIPEEHHAAAFEELTRSDVYAEGWFFLPESGGAPIGYALLAKTFSQEAGGIVLWLDELFVLPEHRGRGIGRRFLQFLAESRADQARWIRLEVEPDNERAAALYAREGFEVISYRQMRRTLPRK